MHMFWLALLLAINGDVPEHRDTAKFDDMDTQRFSIAGRVYDADDPQLQDVLSRVHDTPERPRCLCVRGGVEMYVALHGKYRIKRMPGTGAQHRPDCPSFEMEGQLSGLGELLGEAILEPVSGQIELRVDFALDRRPSSSIPHGESEDVAEVGVPRRRMSLRAVMHYLFEKAQFNRWSPSMEGKRNQWVLQKYLLRASADVMVKGNPLSERLYVPEPFNESAKHDIARRRREKLSILRPRDGHCPMAIVMGEFKGSEPHTLGRRIWIKHMPDTPLLMPSKSWARMERVFASVLEARDADASYRPHVAMAALIRARSEMTYEIEAASLMLTTEQWIPIEGIHELGLIQALIDQRRKFIKPLRYDAKSSAGFASALLLDAGDDPVQLHVLSSFVSPKEREAKEKMIKDIKGWIWDTSTDLPDLPCRRDGASQ